MCSKYALHTSLEKQFSHRSLYIAKLTTTELKREDFLHFLLISLLSIDCCEDFLSLVDKNQGIQLADVFMGFCSQWIVIVPITKHWATDILF